MLIVIEFNKYVSRDMYGIFQGYKRVVFNLNGIRDKEGFSNVKMFEINFK